MEKINDGNINEILKQYPFFTKDFNTTKKISIDFNDSQIVYNEFEINDDFLFNSIEVTGDISKQEFTGSRIGLFANIYLINKNNQLIFTKEIKDKTINYSLFKEVYKNFNSLDLSYFCVKQKHVFYIKDSINSEAKITNVSTYYMLVKVDDMKLLNDFSNCEFDSNNITSLYDICPGFEYAIKTDMISINENIGKIMNHVKLDSKNDLYSDIENLDFLMINENYYAISLDKDSKNYIYVFINDNKLDNDGFILKPKILNEFVRIM